MPGPAGIFDGAMHTHELNRPLYGATLGQAFNRFFKNYANFRGRASRSEFWWMVLIFWGAMIALTVLAAIVESLVYRLPYSTYTATQGVNITLGLLVLAMVGGTLVPWLSIAWRRLHDANLPGPLYLLCLVPYLGSLAVLILQVLPPKPEGRRYDPPIR